MSAPLNTPPERFQKLLAFIEERLEKKHVPDPELVKVHNADPLNKEWQILEDQPWEQSDVVHDLLAFLAEQMIELNKQKQKEIQGFLDWIEREWAVDIEALALKTHLKGYHEHDFDEMLRIAKRNKKLIKPDPESREFQERLEQEWNASMEKLRPLKEKLQLTDNLIDQIVYKLYGLTEEEIRIVEGTHRD
jgi:hypothetical protein